MFENAFIPWLIAQPSLSALISSRLYPGFAPDAVTKPYVVWHLITMDSEHTHQGPAFRSQRIQFSVFADTFTSASGVRDVLLSILDGKRLEIAGLSEVTSFMDSTFHQFEKDTKTHHIAVDFTISWSIVE